MGPGSHEVGSRFNSTVNAPAARNAIATPRDGARRYTPELHELTSVEVADAGLQYPSAASLVQLAQKNGVAL